MKKKGCVRKETKMLFIMGKDLSSFISLLSIMYNGIKIYHLLGLGLLEFSGWSSFHHLLSFQFF